MIVKLGMFWNYAGIICHLFSGSIIHAWDVQLVCPAVWENKINVTLKAYVNKTSLNTKCTANPSNNTFFYLNGSPKCQVDPSKYACRYNEQDPVITDVCDCSDQSNTTYYVFIYRSLADEKLHNGVWDCRPACTNSLGTGYFLTNENIRCDNVTVKDAENETVSTTLSHITDTETSMISTVRTSTNSSIPQTSACFTCGASTETSEVPVPTVPTPDRLWIIVGPIVGVVGGAILVVVLVVTCMKIRQRRKNDDSNGKKASTSASPASRNNSYNTNDAIL